MLGAWRYIILISTIIGAILTSTDPLTVIIIFSDITVIFFRIRYLVF
jgi:Sec-independent protein secretion pathway component TatC